MAYPRAKEDQARFWLNQISVARKKIQPLFEACSTLQKQYYNEASTEREATTTSLGNTGDEHVRRTKSGIVYGWVDQSLANMLEHNPVFQMHPENQQAATKIDPNDPKSLTRAQGMGKIANYRYRTTDQLSVDARVAQDAFMFPYGVVKMGYEVDIDQRFQELEQPGVDLEFTDEQGPEDEGRFLMIGQAARVDVDHDHRGHIEEHIQLLQGGLLHLQDSSLAIAEAAIEEHIALHKLFLERPNPSANSNIRREAPWAVRWLPDMFLMSDMTMEGLPDARWVAFGWELPIEEVQANSSYINTKDLTTVRREGASKEKLEGMESDGFDMVRGWEIWVKNWPIGVGKFSNLLITVTEDSKNFQQYEEEWPYDRLDDYPAECLVFQPGIRTWCSKPPLLMAGGDTVQALMNEILDSYLYIIRKQKNIWLVDPTTGLDTSKIEDILNLPDCSIVEVPGLADVRGHAVLPLPFHDVPPEKGEMLNVLQQMFDRGAGTPQPIQMPRSDTATEAQIIEKRNTSRENRRSALLSNFQVRKARKMMQLDSQFEPKQLFLVDKNAQSFIEMTPEMALGKYLVTMEVTSHANALAVERSQWMDLLNLFAGLTPVMLETFGFPPNLPEIARRLLVRGFSEKVVDEIIPIMDQAAQAQNAAGGGGPPVVGPPGAGPPEAGPLGPEANGASRRGLNFSNPQAQAADDGVVKGRNFRRGIGPVDRQAFSGGAPDAGKRSGRANSAKAG